MSEPEPASARRLLVMVLLFLIGLFVRLAVPGTTLGVIGALAAFVFGILALVEVWRFARARDTRV